MKHDHCIDPPSVKIQFFFTLRIGVTMVNFGIDDTSSTTTNSTILIKFEQLIDQ